MQSVATLARRAFESGSGPERSIRMEDLASTPLLRLPVPVCEGRETRWSGHGPQLGICSGRPSSELFYDNKRSLKLTFWYSATLAGMLRSFSSRCSRIVSFWRSHLCPLLPFLSLACAHALAVVARSNSCTPDSSASACAAAFAAAGFAGADPPGKRVLGPSGSIHAEGCDRFCCASEATVYGAPPDCTTCRARRSCCWRRNEYSGRRDLVLPDVEAARRRRNGLFALVHWMAGGAKTSSVSSAPEVGGLDLVAVVAVVDELGDASD